MKFSCVIFICPLIIASVMAMSITRTTLDGCNPGKWILTNTTLQWENGTIIITSDVLYKGDNGTIYRVRIVIDKCKNSTSNTTCTGEPKVSVENINCTNPNVSESDICGIKDKIGKLVKEWFQDQYSGNWWYNVVICVNFENIDYSSSSESNESK